MEDDLKFFKTVLGSPLLNLLMLENKFYLIHTISLLFRVGGRVGGWVAGWVGGWAAGLIEIKANSVQFQLNLPVGTELGNIVEYSGHQ